MIQSFSTFIFKRRINLEKIKSETYKQNYSLSKTEIKCLIDPEWNRSNYLSIELFLALL